MQVNEDKTTANGKMNLVKSFFSGGAKGALINLAILLLILVLLFIFTFIFYGACFTGSLIGYNEAIKEFLNWLPKQPTFWYIVITIFQITFGGFCQIFTSIVLNGWTKESKVKKSREVGAVCIIWLLFFVQVIKIFLTFLSKEPCNDPVPQFCADLLIPMVGVFAICLVVQALLYVCITVCMWFSKCFLKTKIHIHLSDIKSCNCNVV